MGQGHYVLKATFTGLLSVILSDFFLPAQWTSKRERETTAWKTYQKRHSETHGGDFAELDKPSIGNICAVPAPGKKGDIFPFSTGSLWKA